MGQDGVTQGPGRDKRGSLDEVLEDGRKAVGVVPGREESGGRFLISPAQSVAISRNQ